jgi:hypothetical protein
MIRRITPFGAVAALLLVAGPLTAQGVLETCRSVTMLAPGEWVEYELSGSGTAGITSMRYANVGSQDVGGTPHVWYEFQVSGPQPVVGQMLVPDRLSDMENVKEMVVQMGNQPPMRFTGEMLQMAQQNMQMQGVNLDKQCQEAEVVGEERVTVTAGTFETVHLFSSSQEGHFWVSDDIPFGIVRAQTPQGEMKLVRYGDGAKSSIAR